MLRLRRVDGDGGVLVWEGEDLDVRWKRVLDEHEEATEVALDGPGPWKVSSERPLIDCMDWVDHHELVPVEERAKVEDGLNKLNTYGLVKRNKPVNLLGVGLDVLYDQHIDDKSDQEEDRPVLKSVGSVMKFFGELAIPNKVLGLSRFLKMDKNSDSSSPVLLKDTFVMFALLHFRGTMLCELGTSETNRNRKWHLKVVFIVDWLLGVCFGVILGLYRREIGDGVYDHIGYALQSEVMEGRVKWILSQHAPLGFKLNKDLDQVLGGTVLLLVQFWHVVTSKLAPYSPQLLLGIAVISLLGGGLSFMIGFACDVVLFVTSHVQFLFNFFSKLYRFEISGMSTFWNVVRGKKQNILRKRVDTGEYDTSQLLLGSVAFIVFWFLFQTTLAYYVMFSFLWVSIVILFRFLFLLVHVVLTIPVYTIVKIQANSTFIPVGVTMRVNDDNQIILEGEYATKSSILGCWLFRFIPSLLKLMKPSFSLGAILTGHPVLLPCTKLDHLYS